MTPTAIGRPVRWRFTVFHSGAFPELAEGVLLQTPTGRVYEVLEGRRLAPRWQTDAEATKWALVVVRLDPTTVPEGRTLWPMIWLPRRRAR